MTTELISLGVPRPTAVYGQGLAAATSFVTSALGHLRVMADVLGGNLIEPPVGEVTRDAVVSELAGAAQRLRNATSGLLVLAFAGHGGHMPDSSGDEDDGLDEAWALDDGPLSDDALAELLAAVHHDVHVVVISNCCYSGGMFDDEAWRPHAPPLSAAMSGTFAAVRGAPLRLFARPDEVGSLFARVGRALVDTMEGSLDRAVGAVDRVLQRAADVLGDASLSAQSRRRRRSRPTTPPPDPTNRVIIASCSDRQGTMLTSESRLTRFLLDTVFPEAGDCRFRCNIDYGTLEERVAAMSSVAQTPIVLASPADKRRPAFQPQPLAQPR